LIHTNCITLRSPNGPEGNRFRTFFLYKGSGILSREKGIGYYEHLATRKNESSLNHKLLDHKPRRIPASKVEPAVWDEVKKFVMSDEFSKSLLLRAQAMQGLNEKEANLQVLNLKQNALDRQIVILAERIAKLPENINPKPLFDQLAEMQSSQTKVMAEITEIGSLEDHDTRLVSFENLEVFRKGLRELIQKGENDFSVRSAITKILVHKIEILNDGFEIHFHVGQAHYNQALGDQTPDASFFVSFARCDSSRRLTNGGPRHPISNDYNRM